MPTYRSLRAFSFIWVSDQFIIHESYLFSSHFIITPIITIITIIITIIFIVVLVLVVVV